jgi:capsular polysaccharide export protein
MGGSRRQGWREAGRRQAVASDKRRLLIGAYEMKRTVVLLQGPSSFFFCHLADALQQRGTSIQRVILCPGDAIFWGGRASVAFRGKPGDWPRFIRDLLVQTTATDVIGLGDGRFLHSTAYREARALGIRVHVVEHGYLRPGWLTIEPDGTGGRSRFPRDPALIETLDGKHEDRDSRVLRSSFLAYAAMDVAYNLANVVLGPILYPASAFGVYVRLVVLTENSKSPERRGV